MRPRTPELPPALPGGVEVPGVARGCDGVFTRSQARAQGWSDLSQRRLLRAGVWIPIAGTVLRHAAVELGPWQAARAVHLTAGLVVSHCTAGRLWGLTVPDGLHGIGHVDRRPRHVTVHRLPLARGEAVTVRGMRITSPARTLTDLLCLLDESDTVQMLTDAFRGGLIRAADVHAATLRAHGRYGVTRARQLAHTCRWEPHSHLEWRFHGLAEGLGPGWCFNVDIHDEAGFVGRVDALHPPTATIVELDGRAFHGHDRFQADRTRDQRLAALGHVVVRLTSEDLALRPMECAERLRRTLARRTGAIPSKSGAVGAPETWMKLLGGDET